MAGKGFSNYRIKKSVIKYKWIRQAGDGEMLIRIPIIKII